MPKFTQQERESHFNLAKRGEAKLAFYMFAECRKLFLALYMYTHFARHACILNALFCPPIKLLKALEVSSWGTAQSLVPLWLFMTCVHRPFIIGHF